MATRRTSEHDDPAAVAAFLAALDHPLKPVVEAVRRATLAADPAITEGIKWNSPSFYCHGWFATVNVRPKEGVLVVLHLGAKGRDDGTLRATLADPAGLLTWKSDDRALVAFADEADFRAKKRAFAAIVSQWAKYQTGRAGG